MFQAAEQAVGGGFITLAYILLSEWDEAKPGCQVVVLLAKVLSFCVGVWWLRVSC